MKTAQSLEDIAKAFQNLKDNYYINLIGPFVRSSLLPSDAKQTRETTKQLHSIGSNLTTLRNRRDEQARAVQDAEAAVHELSDQNIKQLKFDIKTRKGNTRQLEIQRTNKKGAIRKAQVTSKKKATASDPSLASLEEELQEIQRAHQQEVRIMHETQARLASITPKKRAHANQILFESRRLLDEFDKAVSDKEKGHKEVETRLLDQVAGFFRSEFYTFIKSERYAYEPLQLAKALAGLPEMACRRSASRCAKLVADYEPGRAYSVFRFIQKTLESRDAEKGLSPDEVFKQAIAALPKTVIAPDPSDPSKKKRRENDFRSYLAENWAYLEPAIYVGMSNAKHPEEVPYLIAAGFEENLRKPRTAADTLFARQERLSP